MTTRCAHRVAVGHGSVVGHTGDGRRHQADADGEAPGDEQHAEVGAGAEAEHDQRRRGDERHGDRDERAAEPARGAVGRR